MKKEFLVAVSVLFGMAASLSVSAQEKLSLKQCREMALKYNKEMAAADKQAEPDCIVRQTAAWAFRVEICRYSCPIPLLESW